MPEATKKSKDAFKHKLSSFCKAVSAKVNYYSQKNTKTIGNQKNKRKTPQKK